MKENKEAEKDFFKGKISFNEMREKMGLKPVTEGNIGFMGEKDKIFFICNGENPNCRKRTCYKRENPPEEPCRHTTNIEYALTFRKEVFGDHASYREEICDVKKIDDTDIVTGSLESEEVEGKIEVVFKLHGMDAVRNLNKFIDMRVLPIKEKYPYAEIHIEVDA